MTEGKHPVTLINRHDPRQREILNALLREVYGFDFTRWDAWDDRYCCYAITEDDRVIANASVALMTVLVNGRPIPAIQIGAVATLPELRGHGLARRVIEHALSRHADRPAFLFAHASVADFYPKFGFQLVTQGRPIVTLATPTTGAGADCSRLRSDSPDLVRRLHEPRQRSTLFDVADADHIARFHLTMQYADDIYLVADLNAIVVARQHGNELRVFEVICDRPITLNDLLARLPFRGVMTVEFGFMPDWLGADYELLPDEPSVSDSHLFVRGLPLAPGLRFPCLATT